MRYSLYILFLLSIVCHAGAQALLSPYSQWVNRSNQATQTSGDRERLVRRTEGVRVVKGSVHARAFLTIVPTMDRSLLLAAGVTIQADYGDIVAVEFPLDNMEKLAVVEGVERIEVALPAQRMMEKSRSLCFVDQAHQGMDLPAGFTGKGVVVGVVDKGFEYGHPNLYSADKKSYRVVRAWNMNATEGTPPASYYKGAHYTNTTDILAAKFDTEEAGETHGMHVVGIAAGADKSIDAYGVATNSDIVLVTPDDADNSSDNVSISNGIKYVYDYAESVGKPAVVNLSWGSYIGPHDGTSTFDRLCEKLTGKGRLLVGSAGNSGSDNIHLARNFAQNTDPLRTIIKFEDLANKLAILDVYGDKSNDFKVDVSVLSNMGEVIYTTNAVQGRRRSNYDFKINNGATGEVGLYSGVDDASKRGNVMVIVMLDDLDEGNLVSVRISPVQNNKGEVNVWCGNSWFSSGSLDGYVGGDNVSSVSELGGTGKGIISVGSFVGRASYKSLNGETYSTNGRIGSLSFFSSQGPTVDGRVKPDVCAPGSRIVSSFSRAAVNAESADYWSVSDKVPFEGADYYYGAMQGTSMSAPYVAGVLALWLEANPELDTQEVLDIIKASAINDDFTGKVATAKSNRWGYGKINAVKGLQEVLARKSSALQKDGLSVTVRTPRPMGSVLYVNFPHSVSGVRFELYSLQGIRVAQQITPTLGSESVELPVLGFMPGVYVLRVEADQGTTNIKVLIPPVGA